VDFELFSVDYPFSTNEMGIEFITAIELSEEQMQRLLMVMLTNYRI